LVLSRVRLIRVRLVLVNLNPLNDTYIRAPLAAGNLKNVYRGPTSPATNAPTAAECNTEAARAGMGTAARTTRDRAAAKNAFTQPASKAPPPQLAA